MANHPDLHSIFEKLGDINATLRDVKHTTNNNTTKIDGLVHLIGKQAEMAGALERIARRQEVNEGRLDALEADRHRRDGAIGVGRWMAGHWPFATVAAALAALIAWAGGKIG